MRVAGTASCSLRFLCPGGGGHFSLSHAGSGRAYHQLPLVRTLDSDERQEFNSLCSRYNHFGGAVGEFEPYLNMSGNADYWGFEPDSPEFTSAAILAVPRTKAELRRKIVAGNNTAMASKTLVSKSV